MVEWPWSSEARKTLNKCWCTIIAKDSSISKHPTTDLASNCQMEALKPTLNCKHPIFGQPPSCLHSKPPGLGPAYQSSLRDLECCAMSFFCSSRFALERPSCSCCVETLKARGKQMNMTCPSHYYMTKSVSRSPNCFRRFANWATLTNREGPWLLTPVQLRPATQLYDSMDF